MSFSIGSRSLGRAAAPVLVLSETLEAPADQYVLDPTLPAIGHDVYIPNNDYIVIARGRLLSVKDSSLVAGSPYANESRPVVTLANGADGRKAAGIGQDLRPLGFAEQQYFRQYSEGTPQPDPQIVKNKLVSLPFILGSNAVYGTLRPNDYITASFGTANGNAPIAQEVGKVVKWQPRRVLSAHQAAGTTIALTGALYPAFVPNIIMGFNAGAYTSAAGSTLTYNATTNIWNATFATAVTDVIFDYGQDADNRAGQVSSFEAVGTAGGALAKPHRFAGWLDWVHDDWGKWDFPPLLTPRPYTNVTAEAPVQIDATHWQLSQSPIVPGNQIAVSVTGTRTDPNSGVTVVLTNSILPLADATFLQDYTVGLDYEVNFVTGVLTIFSNVTVTSLSVSYSAETSFLDGKLYNPGVAGLSDGRFSGMPGTPANLELAGVVAEMRLFMF